MSTNLLDFEVTALHTVYEEARREAQVGKGIYSTASDTRKPRDTDLTSVSQELNLPVVGSQLVGLVPLKALLDAADFYCDKEKLFVLEEEHRIRLVGCACFGSCGGTCQREAWRL